MVNGIFHGFNELNERVNLFLPKEFDFGCATHHNDGKRFYKSLTKSVADYNTDAEIKIWTRCKEVGTEVIAFHIKY